MIMVREDPSHGMAIKSIRVFTTLDEALNYVVKLAHAKYAQTSDWCKAHQKPVDMVTNWCALKFYEVGPDDSPKLLKSQDIETKLKALMESV